MQPQRAFVSYSPYDRKKVRDLYSTLTSKGANLWMDIEELEPGAPRNGAIENAWISCPQIVAILSPAAVKSRKLRREWLAAILQNKQVLPVVIKPCLLPLFSVSQHFDLTANDKRQWQLLLDALPKAVMEKRPSNVGEAPSGLGGAPTAMAVKPQVAQISTPVESAPALDTNLPDRDATASAGKANGGPRRRSSTKWLAGTSVVAALLIGLFYGLSPERPKEASDPQLSSIRPEPGTPAPPHRASFTAGTQSPSSDTTPQQLVPKMTASLAEVSKPPAIQRTATPPNASLPALGLRQGDRAADMSSGGPAIADQTVRNAKEEKEAKEAVPSLVGKTEADAQTTLETASFTATLEKVIREKGIGKVIGSDPTAGTVVTPNTEVTVYIAAKGGWVYKPLVELHGENTGSMLEWANVREYPSEYSEAGIKTAEKGRKIAVIRPRAKVWVNEERDRWLLVAFEEKDHYPPR